MSKDDGAFIRLVAVETEDADQRPLLFHGRIQKGLLDCKYTTKNFLY